MSSESPQVSRDVTLFVTRRTVMADGHVYPTANISHFGPGSIPIFPLPTVVVGALGLLWLLVAAASSADGDLQPPAVLLFICFAAAAAWRVINPKREGLVITMNSGQARIFPTRDKTGTQQVGILLRELLERVEGGNEPKVVTVNDHSVKISGGSFTGQNIMAPIAGDASNHG